MDTRVCSACKVGKPLDQFSKCSARKDGLTAKCKPCDNARRAQYYTPAAMPVKQTEEERREKKREYARRRRQTPEYREYQREYMAQKRQDPEFKAKEVEKMRQYCERKGLELDDLWLEINRPKLAAE